MAERSNEQNKKKWDNFNDDFYKQRISSKKSILRKAAVVTALTLPIIMLGLGVLYLMEPDLTPSRDTKTPSKPWEPGDDTLGDDEEEEEEIDPEPLTVETEYGNVTGREWDDDTYCWLGVPFAKPPLGDLRWKAPEDPDYWGAMNTTDFSEGCMQFANWMGTTNEEDIMNTNVIGSEDCLYMNIWAPKQENGNLPKDLPVFFWIHGGGNSVGQANWPIYYGGHLAEKSDVIVVTINYRLEIVGFMHHWAFGELGNPETPEWDPLDNSGNFAILDMIHALKFVKHNIENFGGDEDCITVSGQSAGGMNTFALLTSPYLKQTYFDMGDPLFHRAMPISGAPMSTEMDEGFEAIETVMAQYLVYNGTAVDEDEAWDMVDDEVLWGDGQGFRDWLMTADMEGLFECRKSGAAEDGLMGVMSMPNLFGDGWVVAEDPDYALEIGEFIRVPTIIGCCEEEVKIFLAEMMDEGAYYDGMFGRGIPDNMTEATEGALDWEDAPEWIKDLFVGFIDVSTWSASNVIRVYGTDWPADDIKTYYPNVWTFQFSWKALPYPLNENIGASHGMDLPFMFGNIEPEESWPVNNTAWVPENYVGRKALSDYMMGFYKNFMYNGDPGGMWEPWRYRMFWNGTMTENTSYVAYVSEDLDL